ncbi:hypothetical protein [Amycolatopsis saalfeldensis]|nr:hypothetical protein [Amycolatopsis saalfeldensis]
MGKHTQRKPGYLPKVAASAAPFALLLAAPASALAEPTLPIEGLPLGHQETATFDHGLHTTTDAAHGSLGLTRHDVLPVGAGGFSALSDFRHALSDTQELTGGGSLTAVKSAGGTAAVSRSQRHDVRLGSPVRLMSGNEQHFTRSCAGTLAPSSADTCLNGVGGSAENGVWLPYGVDALSQDSGQADAGHILSFDAGHFTGDLRGGAGVHRSAAQAVDAGQLGSVVLNSEQHGLGQFTGRLDHPLSGNLGANHIAGGTFGPVSGLLATTQSADPGGASNSFRGSLTVNEVGSTGGAVTASGAGGRLSLSPSVTGAALGQPPVTVSTPPLVITPQ